MPESITATVNKSAEDTKVGITLVSRGGKIYVEKATGLFGMTAIQAGDEVVTINNQLVEGMAVYEATGIIKAAVGDITVVAKRGASPVVATVVGGDAGASPVVATVVGGDAPPGKAAPGGVWGTVKYAGPETQRNACIACLCCGCLGLCLLACPSDEKDAYAVENKVYDAAGIYVGPQDSNFTPKQQTMRR